MDEDNGGAGSGDTTEAALSVHQGAQRGVLRGKGWTVTWNGETWSATSTIADQLIATATAFGTATGATAGSQAAIDRETWSLAATAKTLAPGDPLIANLQNYIALINTIPGSVETNFNAGGRTLHAQGGVFSSAHVGMVAEDGPEAIIPLSKPGRAADVMRQAGLIGSGTGGDVTIVVNVQGSVVTQQQLDDAIYQGLLRRKQLQGSLNLS